MKFIGLLAAVVAAAKVEKHAHRGVTDFIPMTVATSRRPHFGHWAPENQDTHHQIGCMGYRDERLRERCEKNSGVYTDKAKSNYNKRVAHAVDKCSNFEAPQRKRECINAELRLGSSPYIWFPHYRPAGTPETLAQEEREESFTDDDALVQDGDSSEEELSF